MKGAEGAKGGEGRESSARFVVKYGVNPGGAICCGAFANKEHGVVHLFQRRLSLSELQGV